MSVLPELAKLANKKSDQKVCKDELDCHTLQLLSQTVSVAFRLHK